LAVLEKVAPKPKAPAVVIEQNNIMFQIPDEMLERIKVLAARHGLDAMALLDGQMPHELAGTRAKH
jgi:hypothetical protein